MLTKMQKIVLGYPKLKERIDSRQNSDKERDKALKNLDEIKATFSPATIKGFIRFLDATIPRLYDGIDFDDSQADVKKLIKDKCVVLVPNHQSHADYVAINYTFYGNYKFPLYVAGGVNLNIFPIGTLFRRCGCFFIRRSFANDITYKLTLEAYLYYLLKMGRPVEFFFEGGRSRTGKLLSPRFGLYGMLLDAHQELIKEKNTPLIFVPVSIVHEYVPEQKSLAQELSGAKKKKESTGQLFGLVKLFAYQFGSIHVRLGRPVEAPQVIYADEDEHRMTTQELAFKCFREVGRNMLVTPTSLLALVLLDEPSGAMLWQDIVDKCQAILDYCDKREVPITDSLKGDSINKSLERAMDILIGNKRVDVIGREHQGHLYYSIREECRHEILYFKNTILHHFLVPAIIGDAWVNVFSGRITNTDDIKQFFLKERRQLIHEFYLPTVKEFFYKTLTVVSEASGKRVGKLEDFITLDHKDLYRVASVVGIFTRALSYIKEAYFVSGKTILQLHGDNPMGFKRETYQKKAKEIHESEKRLSRLIRYPESYSLPLCQSSLKFYSHAGIIENEAGTFLLRKPELLEEMLASMELMLLDQLAINIRAVPS